MRRHKSTEFAELKRLDGRVEKEVPGGEIV